MVAPSWGRRRSAMSIPDMILMRLTMGVNRRWSTLRWRISLPSMRKYRSPPLFGGPQVDVGGAHQHRAVEQGVDELDDGPLRGVLLQHLYRQLVALVRRRLVVELDEDFLLLGVEHVALDHLADVPGRGNDDVDVALGHEIEGVDGLGVGRVTDGDDQVVVHQAEGQHLVAEDDLRRDGLDDVVL